MICNICGQQLPDNAKFCSRCGAKHNEVNNNQNFGQNGGYQIPHPDNNQSPNQNNYQNQGYQIPRPNQYQNQNQGYQYPPNQYQNYNQNYNNYQNQGQRANKTNSFAVAGFILGIASLVLWWIDLGVIGILAIIFSSLGLGNSKELIKRDKVFAILGLIFGIISLILTVIWFIPDNYSYGYGFNI